MRARIAIAAVAIAGCGGGGDGEPADGAADGGDGGDRAPVLREVVPASGPYGTFVELRGAGLDPAAGDAEILWDGATVTGRTVARGKCAGDRPYCFAWYEWTDARIVVVVPVTRGPGTFSVRAGGVSTGALPFGPTEKSVPTGDRGMEVGAALVQGRTLVTARIDGSKLGVRVVAAEGGVRALLVAVGDGVASGPFLRRGPSGVEIFAAGGVGADTRLFHGPAEGPLADTGVPIARKQVNVFAATARGGEPAAWIQAPDASARLAWREAAAWKWADSANQDFDIRMGNTVALDAVESGGAVHVAVAINHGSFNPKYDVGYLRLEESGGVVVAASETVKVGGDDFARQPVLRVGADGVPEIFHVENVSLSTNLPVVWRRTSDRIWSRTSGDRLPFAVRGGEAGFTYVFDPYDKGAYLASTHVLVAEAPDGSKTPLSGDLQPVFHDPLLVLWDETGLPSFLARDRHPNLSSSESGGHRWFVRRP